jgi:hypothetical protein
VGIVVVPVAVVAVVFVLNVTAGATAAVLAVGVGAASVMFVKNRTDRHNAALDRGEITVPGDPHLRAASVSELPDRLLRALATRGLPPDQVGQVTRFDGGWLVCRRNRREVAIVAGDDGGWAQFDPRIVVDQWAAMEFLAGRGLEPDRLFD